MPFPYYNPCVAFDHIVHNLRAAGMDVNDLIKITYYLVGDIDMAKRRELILSGLQGYKPCSTLLYVTTLASPAYKVEIDAWAPRPE